jgi:hypothetical protein
MTYCLSYIECFFFKKKKNPSTCAGLVGQALRLKLPGTTMLISKINKKNIN